MAVRSKKKKIKKKTSKKKVRGKDILPRPMGALIKATNKAVARLGEDNPLVQEAMQHLLAIARGEKLERHCGERVRALRELLDRTKGKVTIPIKVEGGEKPVLYKAVLSDGSALNSSGEEDDG